VAKPLTARGEQPSGALRRRKQSGADHPDRHRRQARRPPADLVGKATEEQKRGKIAENVGRVNQRQRDAGKSKSLAVQRIERCRQDRADEHDAEFDRDRGHRDSVLAGGCGIAHCHTSIRFMRSNIDYGITPKVPR
jgi:hypothetical protein